MKKFLLLLTSLALGFGLFATEVTDVLTAGVSFGITVSSENASYEDLTCTNAPSGTEYAANMAKTNLYLQMRSTAKDNKYSGIVSTTSKGKVKSITITWNSKTASSRKVNVYGSNEPYTTPNDLYASGTWGNSIATFTYDSSNLTQSQTFEVGDQYAFIGIRSASNPLYLDKVEITWELAEEGAVLPPFFDPQSESIVDPGTEVTIGCATEGAKIYYTLDESDPTAASTLYENPIAINDYTVIKAVAELNGKLSDVATAYYMVTPTIESLTNLTDFEDKTPFITGMPLTVVYKNGKYVYVYDGSSYGLLYNQSNTADVSALKAGDVIKPGLKAKISMYSGLLEFVATSAVEVEAQPGTVPEPISVSAEMASAMSMASANSYWMIENVSFADATPATASNFTGMGIDEEGEPIELTFRNTFTIGSVAAGSYNVICFVGIYNGGVQYYPVEYISNVIHVESLTSLSDLPEGTEFVMDVPLTVIYANGNTAYVTDGTSNAIITAPGLEAKFIINADWSGKVAVVGGAQVMQPTGDLTCTNTATTAIEPMEVDGEDVAYMLAPYNANAYLKLNMVRFAAATPASGTFTGTMDGAEDAISFENKFGVAPVEAGVYNVTGFVGANGQLIVTEIEKVVLRVEDFNSLLDLPSGVEFAYDGNASALYSNNKIAYLTDGYTNIMVVGDELGIATGDKLDKGWHAVVNVVNRQMQVTIVSGLSISGKAMLRQPTPVEADDAAYLLGESNLNAYVKLMYVEVADTTPVKGNFTVKMYTSDGDVVDVTMRNEFGVAAVEPGTYDVTGFVGIYEYTDLFYPISFAPSAPILEDLSPISDLEDETMFRFNGKVNVIYSVGPMAYVTDGTYNVMVGTVNGEDLKARDILLPGWTGMVFDYNGLKAVMIAGDFELAAEKAAPVQPIPVDPADAPMMVAPFTVNSYLTLMNVYFAEDTEEEAFEGIIETGDEPFAVNFYNMFYIDPVEAGLYDVTGFVGNVEGETVFFPTAFAASTPILEDLSPISDMEDETMFTFNGKVNVIYSVGPMAYVTDGTYNVMVGTVNGENLEACDILLPGWLGMVFDYNGLKAVMIAGDLQIAEEKAEPVQPTPVDPEDAPMMVAPYTVNSYLTLMKVNFAEATDEEAFTGTINTGDEDFTVNFYNMFYIEGVEAGVYDVTGFVGNVEGETVFFPTAIVEHNEDGLGSVAIDLTQDAYYNLQGVKVVNPAAGNVYIRVQNGKAIKIKL